MNPQSVAYLKSLYDVYHKFDFITETVGDHPNQKATREKINVHITIQQPTREPVLTGCLSRDSIILDYTSREKVAFDEGDITTMGKVSSFWDKIKNPDGTINANYGYMVFYLKDAGNQLYDPECFKSQWDWAKSRLLLRQDTCQAIMHFNRPKDQWSGNLDQPCCMYSQFLIRENRLHLFVSMRSNDLWFGTPYNWSYHIELLYRMHEQLLETYRDIEIGNFYFSTTSLHIYNRHYSKVKEILGSENFKDLFPQLDGQSSI